MRRVAETCDCIELDLEELAWAAGLFDGEGTTIAKRDVRRPDRFQLQVTVPQCGRDGLPEVLVRFHRAVLGMGVIDAPNKYSMYRWRARGFVDGQAAVAMLWPFLSGVKRGQAASAFRNVAAQYRTGRFTGMQRRPRAPAVRVPHAPHGAALRRPTRLDLQRAWAAGFFDGEGWTGRVRSRQRKKGPTWYRVRASINQNGEDGASPAVLARFHRAVDGAGRIEPQGEIDAFKWIVEDLPGVERVLGLLRPWLGVVKLTQAASAIAAFNAQIRLKGDAAHCVRGPEYTGRRMRGGRLRRICNACERISGRAQRAAQGIAPRRFKNASRRYNS